MFGFAEKLCTLNVRNVRICREIEHPELRKINKKFCTLYLHKMFGFAEKLIVYNCVNSTKSCVHYMYGMSGFA